MLWGILKHEPARMDKKNTLPLSQISYDYAYDL
jgi:hypothetical protein